MWPINTLINKIEKENNLFDFRDQLSAIVQLYFDGLIKKEHSGTKEKNKVWSEQKLVLDKLNNAGKLAYGSFYRGNGIDFDKVREMILPNASKIIKYSNEENAKPRHLANSNGHKEIQDFGLILTEIASVKEPFDTIVCCASGGFEPSFLAMDILEKNTIVPVRYSWVSGDRQDFKVKFPKYAPDDYLSSKVDGKKVLVVEDVVSSGRSLAEVLEMVEDNKPGDLWVGVVENLSGPIPSKVLEKLKNKNNIFGARSWL